jgi:hypothetical protein
MEHITSIKPRIFLESNSSSFLNFPLSHYFLRSHYLIIFVFFVTLPYFRLVNCLALHRLSFSTNLSFFLLNETHNIVIVTSLLLSVCTRVSVSTVVFFVCVAPSVLIQVYFLYNVYCVALIFIVALRGEDSGA